MSLAASLTNLRAELFKTRGGHKPYEPIRKFSVVVAVIYR